MLLDLYTDDGAGEFERRLGLGATRDAAGSRPADDVVVHVDPDGYRFRCCRSCPDRTPALDVDFSLERMMGFEPTTFCMASRRSSQLSYIRERPKYSRARLDAFGVEGLVDEPVRELVVLAPHRAVGDLVEARRPRRIASRQSSRSASFLTLQSPRIWFTSSSESETTSTSSSCSSAAFLSPSTSARYSATLLVATPIVSPCAARTVPSLGLEHVAVGRRARVAARSPVGEQARLHRSG